jgi:phospholipid/cholesterol/gamma-HCH transport system substrate-binding protein
MGRKSIETLVGLFVLIGALAVIFLALKAANLASFTSGSTYNVKASFDNIGGLKVRAPVRSAGVTVGRVVAITLDAKTYRGVVTLEINKGIDFPTDSSAKILTAGLLGDQYIGLEPGGDEKVLQPGDSIQLTQSAIVLENLIGQLLFKGASDAGAEKK